MTQEEKQQLLKDLCARLPYGLVVYTKKGDGHLCSINQTLFSVEYGVNINPVKRDYFNDIDYFEIKPYLRPMSSMTDEEKKKVFSCISNGWEITACKEIDWLNAHHFDYRGLIPMGLALESPKDMYKTE